MKKNKEDNGREGQQRKNIESDFVSGSSGPRKYIGNTLGVNVEYSAVIRRFSYSLNVKEE